MRRGAAHADRPSPCQIGDDYIFTEMRP
jgi:hypothetical protein